MATPPQKAKAFSMTAAALQKLGAKMDQLPQASINAVNSRMAALIMLRPHIARMRSKGYDYAEIAAWLADNAPLSVSPSTIRTALSKARNAEIGDTGKASTPDKLKSESAPAAAVPDPQRPKQEGVKQNTKKIEKPVRSGFGDDHV
jgi:hypothetical protein